VQREAAGCDLQARYHIAQQIVAFSASSLCTCLGIGRARCSLQLARNQAPLGLFMLVGVKLGLNQDVIAPKHRPNRGRKLAEKLFQAVETNLAYTDERPRGDIDG
jgi:hypothetical protein